MADSEDKERQEDASPVALGEEREPESRSSDEGCPVRMRDEKRCGRAIYPAPDHDRTPVCVMHSRDPDKSNEDFQREFERTVRAAGDEMADFTLFVFPRAQYHSREFKARCVFHQATFTEYANFSGSTFAKDIDFTYAEFKQGCYFRGATIQGGADFSSAIFAHGGDFAEARFMQAVDFRQTNFIQQALFTGADFLGESRFDRATFTRDAAFTNANFSGDALFRHATFMQEADFAAARFVKMAVFSYTRFMGNSYFVAAEFTGTSDFLGSTFSENSSFHGAKFAQSAIFSQASFAQDAIFSSGGFAREVSFAGAKFLGRVDFRETKFRGHGKTGEERRKEFLPGPIFSLAEFTQPEKVVFYKNCLGQALFYNCDVSQVNFSLVEWRRRKGSRKWMVFEEEVDLKAAAELKTQPDPETQKEAIDERRYWLIIELYQQLKKNYDERKDYGTAGDFHYGELEMRRLATGPAGRIMQLMGGGILGEQRLNRVRRRWHQHFSLVALYKYASQYGESYARPAFWFLVTLFFFAGLFPWAGLRYDPSKDRAGGASASEAVLTYTSPLLPGQGAAERYKAQWRLFGNSFVTALEIAAFQKEPAYRPAYTRGRVLTLIEMLLTSTLAALFFLAVRRQFRR